MTSLKYLRVHVGFSLVDISLESIAYPMTLPDLQELALRIYGPSALFWAWMSNLNASCLWYLYLEHHIPRGSLFDEEPVQQLGQAELASLQAAVHLPSLTHFHCELEPPLHSGHPKNLDMVAFMPAINTISKMTLFSWSGTRTFLKFLTFDCTFPQLQHVKFIGILNDPQEDVPKLKGTITRLCPSAIVTFEE
ncbi:hypothetical protein FRC02_006473 [Tulasnella sp. 418]|nr:hypothetical protein FRC02_006473 [Tulasnella sp. 418]